MGTFWILVSLILFVCILLILVIMVQNPKGGGLSSTFGGQQQIGGVKSTTDFLDKSTWALAVIILVLILISNVTLMNDSDNTDSILIDESIPEQSIPEIPEQNIPEIPIESIDD